MVRILFITALCFLFNVSLNAQTTYNFNDGNWGEAVTERPESGSFSTTVINNLKMNNVTLFQKDGKGFARLIFDKSSKKSSVEFPAFENAKEVIIDASVGSEDKAFVVEEKVGQKWLAIGEPTVLTKQKSSTSFPLSKGATQIRILNGSASALYVFKVTIQ